MGQGQNQEMVEAGDYCVRDVAISHLMERDKCAEKADRFVDYVFEKCKNDMAPFVSQQKKKVRAMSDLL